MLNPIFYKPGLLQLFIYCLVKANHKENEFIFNDEMIKVESGSFISGRKNMAKELKCKEKTIYNRLQKLKKLGYIYIKSTNRFSIIEVINYKKYQNTDKKLPPETLENITLSEKTNAFSRKRRKTDNKKDLKSIDNIELSGLMKNKEDNKRTTRGQQEDTNNNDKEYIINKLIDNEEINKRVFQEITNNFAKLKNKNKPESSDYAEINRFLKIKESDSFSDDGMDKIRKLLLLWQILSINAEKIRAGKYYPYIKACYENASYSDYQKILNNPFAIKYKEKETFVYKHNSLPY